MANDARLTAESIQRDSRSCPAVSNRTGAISAHQAEPGSITVSESNAPLKRPFRQKRTRSQHTKRHEAVPANQEVRKRLLLCLHDTAMTAIKSGRFGPMDDADRPPTAPASLNCSEFRFQRPLCVRSTPSPTPARKRKTETTLAPASSEPGLNFEFVSTLQIEHLTRFIRSCDLKAEAFHDLARQRDLFGI
jgi:hypothetical protein